MFNRLRHGGALTRHLPAGLHLTPWSFEASVRRALCWTRSEDRCSRKDRLLVLLSGDPSRCLETAAPGPREPSPRWEAPPWPGSSSGVRATSSRPALCTPLPLGWLQGSGQSLFHHRSSEPGPYPMVSARCAPGPSPVPHGGSHSFCPRPASSRAPPQHPLCLPCPPFPSPSTRPPLTAPGRAPCPLY